MSDHDLAHSAPASTAPEQAPAHAASVIPAMRSAKIQKDHLDRLAAVYVRQSSTHQVLHHRESRERQYALVHRAVALGWSRERVLTIDEDQGHSAKTSEGRSGFHRIMSEVTMGHLGLVLGIEMARLARCNKDWHQLLELCAVFGTVLADEDGVYDPNDSNDRLLLGLKGTISEYELVTMRNRLERGKLNKAQRGELFHRVPFGYVQLPTGEVVFDPDEQARAVVQLLFDKFAELGTLHGLFRYLVRNKICLGMRIQDGPQRGMLAWQRPRPSTLNRVLHNPIYAGAYAYGRCLSAAQRRAAGPARPRSQWLPPSQWKVLIRDRLPSYITWEQYQANQQRLQQNRSMPGAPGTPRRGAALLTGLLVCGCCDRRFRASYAPARKACYHCDRHIREDTADPACTALQAAAIDGAVTREVLRAIEPASLELSLKAMEDLQRERGGLHRHWKQRLERARYDAQRIERQYQAVEPENRLVARTLERRWEEALGQQQQLQEDYDRFQREQPPQLRDDERARIQVLSASVPALWDAPTTTAVDRKEIVRLLVERVVVQVHRRSEYVEATIHWRGGCTSAHQIVRPVQRYDQLRDYDRLIDRMTQWRREGRTAAQIAEKLNQEGYRTPKTRGDYTRELVLRILASRRINGKPVTQERLGGHEWRTRTLAAALHIAPHKLRDWAKQGWVKGRKTGGGWWIVWADASERDRLMRLAARSKRGSTAYPKSWKTPAENSPTAR
jgi:DNA invertase Pin-like site-specific DNA recombinase